MASLASRVKLKDLHGFADIATHLRHINVHEHNFVEQLLQHLQDFQTFGKKGGLAETSLF